MHKDSFYLSIILPHVQCKIYHQNLNYIMEGNHYYIALWNHGIQKSYINIYDLYLIRNIFRANKGNLL